MVVIAGCVVVLSAVLAGFTMAGGKVASLVHPSEFVTIGGAAFGALLIMSPRKVLKDLGRGLAQLFKGSPYTKETYFDLFKALYLLAREARQGGVLALDSHVSNPEGSAIFQQTLRLRKNHHAMQFLCDALSLIVDGKPDGGQLTAWLGEEIKVTEREHHAAVGALSKTADALPGFGIVAAVLGIVVTMTAIGGPVEEIGHKVGAALVGTFLGILLSYGFFAPMAGRMELLGEEETTFFHVIVVAVVALSEGAAPKDVVVRACRSVGTDCRPSPGELRQIFNESSAS